MTNAELYNVANLFRRAIIGAVRAGDIKKMANFPRGCCGYASDLLQRYLVEKYNFYTLYISGTYGNGWDGESHAWLETQDEIVIDITGDQYKFSKMKFSEPIYVGPREDGFHDMFKLNEAVGYSKQIYDLIQNNEFDKRYKAVMQHIDSIM